MLIPGTVLAPFVGALGAIALWRRPRAAWGVALGTAVVTLVTACGAAARGAAVDIPWIPTWNARIRLAADPLGALLAVLAAAIAVLVIGYARPYLAHHLRTPSRDPSSEARFHALMLLFLGAMVGLAFAADLVLFIVFFDLTVVASYALIGFDRAEDGSRVAALTAVVVTGFGSAALLLGALVWTGGRNTFELAALAAEAGGGVRHEWAAALVVLAALIKSGQVPFHFWLVRAMAAPTPVSAYLHSAAMLAAGAFLLLRLQPLLEGTVAAAALPFLGLASIFVGSVLALGADRIKQLLAYSTVAQYGYVVLLVGLGGATGIGGAALYLVAHAAAKSALFLTAGAVQQATGTDRLSELGGLGRRMPGLALTSGVCAAALAGLPPTVGYLKDEALFAAVLERHSGFAAAAVLGVALTLAYTLRFWIGLFMRRQPSPGPDRRPRVPTDVEEPAPGRVPERPLEPAPPLAAPPLGLTLPVAVLAVLVLAAGALPGLLSRMAARAAGAAALRPLPFEVGYSFDPALLLASTAYVLGAALYVLRERWVGWAGSVQRLGRRIGPEAAYEALLAGLNRASGAAHALEVRDLRDRVAAILPPAGLLVILAVVIRAGMVEWQVGPIWSGQVPLLIVLVVLGITSLSATVQRTHLGLVLALSATGFTLAAVYALLGAPDLALVAVLVETLLVLLLLAAFSAVSPGVLARGGGAGPPPRMHKRRHRSAGALGGAVAFAVAWAALSVRDQGGVAEVHAAWSGRVHARDPVAAILSDFRGLDTAGEATVIALALLGLLMLLEREDPAS